jgi:hypothetical protein
MSRPDSIDLVDAVYESLEPHGSYISLGPDDENLYFAPVEVVEALAWIAVNVLLPTMTGVAASAVSSHLARRDQLRAIKALEASQEELARIRHDVNELVIKSEQTPNPTNDLVERSRDDISLLLRLNGWPADLADMDSEVIISAVLRELWP